jgi:hypothetical protein
MTWLLVCGGAEKQAGLCNPIASVIPKGVSPEEPAFLGLGEQQIPHH